MGIFFGGFSAARGNIEFNVIAKSAIAGKLGHLLGRRMRVGIEEMRSPDKSRRFVSDMVRGTARCSRQSETATDLDQFPNQTKSTYQVYRRCPPLRATGRHQGGHFDFRFGPGRAEPFPPLVDSVGFLRNLFLRYYIASLKRS